MTLTFPEARAAVLREILPAEPVVETVSLDECAGRILAEDITADRDYPPFPRSARDGFAIRSADAPGRFRVLGESRAGAGFDGAVGPGECVEIMTGAPVPAGADAVIMVEHVVREADRIIYEKEAQPGEALNPRGEEAREGELVLRTGQRLDFPRIAMLATVGRTRVRVYRRPQVAILPTGDEIVAVDATPGAHQIRNSNAHALAAQVARAGGEPHLMPVAPDRYDETRALVERGLASDLLLLSGGVSAGKYDIVERVLADLGAEFVFTRVKIQPGQPLVFGWAPSYGPGKPREAGTPFFGLPGNPASTMVTFEIFARAAVERLAGSPDTPLPILWGKLTREFKQRPGLTRFLPALVEGDQVTPLAWHGSGDIPTLARANAFLVSEPARAEWAAGDWIQVLLR